MTRGRATLTRITRDDSGVAIVITMAVAMLIAVLMVIVITVAIRESNASGRDRQRSAAVTTAEGQVDSLVAGITGTPVGGLPCGVLPASNQVVGPDGLTFTRAVTYFAADGSQITNCAGMQAGTVAAASAKIVVTSVSGSLAGQAPARRTVETLLNLTPVIHNSMQKAIFGNAGVNASGNLSVTSGAKNADVYTNGDFVCNGNEVYQGNLTAATGSITMQNSCQVIGNVSALSGLISTNGHPTIGGKAVVTNGNMSLGGIYIAGVGAARASGTVTGTACATPGTCVSNVTTLAPLQQEPFPELTKANQIDWFVNKQGYTEVDVTDPTAWLMANGATMTSDTVLVTTNRMTMSQPVNNLALNRNVAILADGGFDIQKAKDILSTTSASRNLYFIQPYDAVTTHPCYSNYGVQISNLVTMDATINDLVYTPCNVYKANQGVHQGQVYGGGIVTLDNNTSLAFVPLPTGNVDYATVLIDSYSTNIVYTRENVG